MTESQNVEWKESWRDEYFKWICAFANSQGGQLFIGVNDSGEVVGIDEKECKRLLEDIPNKSRDILGILPDVNRLSKDGKTYIEISVVPSSFPISYRGEYHVRIGSTKQQLTGNVLTQFLTEKLRFKWDAVPTDVTPNELDEESFRLFKEVALRNRAMSDEDLNVTREQMIDNLNLMDAGKLLRAGVMLFHRNPEKWVRGAYTKIAFFEDNANIAYQDEVHGSLIYQAENVIDLLYFKYLKAYISYDDMVRVDAYQYPKNAIREAVYNALAHKNYADEIPIQISVYDDKLYIANGCTFPKDWTEETLFQKHSSRAFNPNIAGTFFRIGYVEAWGRGVEKMCEACAKHGIPKPKFIIHEEDIMICFESGSKDKIRTSDKSKPSLKPSSKPSLKPSSKPSLKPSSRQDKDINLKIIVSEIKKNKNITQMELVAILNVSRTTLQSYLKELMNLGIIQRVGGKRYGYWKVKGKK